MTKQKSDSLIWIDSRVFVYVLIALRARLLKVELLCHFWTVCHFLHNVKIVPEAISCVGVIYVEVRLSIVRICCSACIDEFIECPTHLVKKG